MESQRICAHRTMHSLISVCPSAGTFSGAPELLAFDSRTKALGHSGDLAVWLIATTPTNRKMIGSTALLLAAFGTIEAFSPGRREYFNIASNQGVQTCAYFRRDRELLAVHVFKAADGSAIADDGNGDDDSGPMMNIEQLTSSQLLELVELSFVQSVVALSETGEVDPLKLFIVAVKTAARRMLMCEEGGDSCSLPALIDSVPQSMKQLDDPELKLRGSWITAICLMLNHADPIEYDNVISEDLSDNDIIDNVMSTYGPIVKDLVAIHESGLGLNIDNFVESRRDLLGIRTSNVLALEETAEDDVQFAVVSQTIKVMYNTLVVLADEKAMEDLAADIEQKTTSSSRAVKKKKGKKSSGGRGFGYM